VDDKPPSEDVGRCERCKAPGSMRVIASGITKLNGRGYYDFVRCEVRGHISHHEAPGTPSKG
jgi:hypothetical protein